MSTESRWRQPFGTLRDHLSETRTLRRNLLLTSAITILLVYVPDTQKNIGLLGIELSGTSVFTVLTYALLYFFTSFALRVGLVTMTFPSGAIEMAEPIIAGQTHSAPSNSSTQPPKRITHIDGPIAKFARGVFSRATFYLEFLGPLAFGMLALKAVWPLADLNLIWQPVWQMVNSQ